MPFQFDAKKALKQLSQFKVEGEGLTTTSDV